MSMANKLLGVGSVGRIIPYSLAGEAIQYLDKGILPKGGETIDTFLKRAERIFDRARRFDPTLPFIYHDNRGVGHKVRPEYGFGFNQLPDERVRQLYGADTSWMPVIGVNPEYWSSVFKRPRTCGGMTIWLMGKDENQPPFSLPLLISFMLPLNHPVNSQVIPHERVHGMREKSLPSDDDLHQEFYAYDAGGNVDNHILSQSTLQRKLAYAGFRRTLQEVERVVSVEFGSQAARYVIGRASFKEAKEIARCQNGRGLEKLLQKKAGADLRWELLQRKLEGA